MIFLSLGDPIRSDRLGHGSIRTTTMDTYAHLFEHDDDEQLVALGGKIEAALS